MAHKGKKIKETALEAALEGLSLNGKSKGPGESNGPGAVGSPLRRQIKKLTRRAARAAKERIAYGTGNTPGASELPRLRKIKSLKRQEQNGVPPRITYETLRRQTQEAARLAREGIQSKEENQFFKNPISDTGNGLITNPVNPIPAPYSIAAVMSRLGRSQERKNQLLGDLENLKHDLA